MASSPGSSITSPSASSTRSFDLGVHPVRSGGRKKEGFSLARQGSAGTLTVGSLPSYGFDSNKSHMRNSSMGSLEYLKKTESVVLPRQASTSSLPNSATQLQSSESSEVPTLSQANAMPPSQDFTLDRKGGAIHKQTSNDSSKSDSSSRKAYAFSSGYATQSSDSSQDLAPGGAGIEKSADSNSITQNEVPPQSLLEEDNSLNMQTEMLSPKDSAEAKHLPKLDTGAIIR